jgi:hypothetical protein
MPSKKVIIGGVLAGILAISAIIFIPLVVFSGKQEEDQLISGYFTKVAVINVGMDLGSTSSISTSSISTSDYTPSMPDASAEESIVPIESYALNQWGGPGEVSGSGGLGGGLVDINMTFNLTTPSNNTLIFELKPRSLSASSFNAKLMLSANQLNETGTFHLEIAIDILVKPPSLPEEELHLTPVNLTFEYT